MDRLLPTPLRDWEEPLVDPRQLRPWLLDLVSRDRQDVDCQSASLGLLLVLADLALASAHPLLVARQDLEDHHLALVDVEDPQADLVSCTDKLSRIMTDQLQLASLPLADPPALEDPQASVDRPASRAAAALLVLAEDRECRKHKNYEVFSSISTRLSQHIIQNETAIRKCWRPSNGAPDGA
jgi:hypothetical protein